MSQDKEETSPQQDSEPSLNPDIEYTRRDGSVVKVDFDPLEWVVVTFLLVVLLGTLTATGLI